MPARLATRRALSALVATSLLTALSASPVAANEPPTVSVRGPAFVPVSSASPRLFVGGAFDHDSDSFTHNFECGPEPPVASGPWQIRGQEWFTCSMSSSGTHLVAVRAQDSDGGQSAAVKEIVATTRVRSVADAHLVTIGHNEERPFGGTLAFVDLNGDGKSDLATGVAEPRGSPQSSGVRDVHVLFGRTAGGTVHDDEYTGTTGFQISGTVDEHFFGTSLANAGDVNGDGRRDIIIGSPTSDGVTESRAYVVFGRSNISSLTPATMTASQGFRISAPGLGCCIEVAGGGDINGDGFYDVVVGTPSGSLGQTGSPGAAHVVYGKANPTNVDLSATPSTYGARLAGSTHNARVGQSVALGDVNGDNKADVVLGTSDYPGHVRVVFGRSTLTGVVNVESMPASLGFTVSSTGNNNGRAVAAGDLNGDGRAEVLAATEHFFTPYDIRSRVSVIVGQNSPTSFSLDSAPAGRTFEVLMPVDETVATLAAADWNGDNKVDLLIGARDADELRGSAYIVPGQANLTNVQLEVLGAWHRIDGDTLYASAGEGLAAGDFNGDSRVDVAVGAPWAITEAPDPFSFGRVGIFLGTGSSAADRTPPNCLSQGRCPRAQN